MDYRAGLWAVALVLAVLLTGCSSGSPAPVCQYDASDVSVIVSGPDCIPTMETVAGLSHETWYHEATFNNGAQIAQVAKGQNTIRIYQDNNSTGPAKLAGLLTASLEEAGWNPQIPTSEASARYPGTEPGRSTASYMV